MARIVEKTIVVRVSKIARNTDDKQIDIPEEVITSLEAFLTELIDDTSTVVEIEAE